MNDSIEVTAEPDNNGYGTGPEGNGDSRDNGVGNINVKYDPGSSMSFKIVRDDGLTWTVDVVGVAFKDVPNLNAKFEGFIDASPNKNNNSKDNNSYNKNLPVKDIVKSINAPQPYGIHYQSVTRDIQENKFDSSNRLSFYHHGFNYSVQVNEDGNIIDYNEQKTGKTQNADMSRYSALGDAKRKDIVTKLV